MLDERKRRVLLSVIDDYIETAEPVGSRTLARKYDLGVSAATIRNEMADLEMLGFLEHLHTSSGRVPSAKGWRFYVDGLLPPRQVSDEEKAIIDEWYRKKVQRLDEVFHETAKLIANVTKSVAIVVAPQIQEAAFRCLQFLPLDKNRSIAVLLTDAGFVENKIVDMPDGATFEDFRRLAETVNELLAGKALKSVGESLKQIRDAINDAKLYDAAEELIYRALDGCKAERLYLGGTRQLLEQPEFRDVARVKNILLVLEEEEIIKDILRAHRGAGLNVSIGRENEDEQIKDCSIVTASYHMGRELLGTVAVLGPTRMQYGKAIALLNYLNDNMTQIVKKIGTS